MTDPMPTAAASSAPSQFPPALRLSHDLAGIVDAAAASIVAVRGGGRRPSSGIIWQPGIVVTAEETVERDGDLAIVLPDGRRVAAELAGRDSSTDIAVLRFDAADVPTISGFAAAPHAMAVRPGHLALAIGRADADPVATLGMVSRAGGAWHSSHGGLIDARLVIDARLPSSTEGGALVAADGALIGMAVFGPRRRVLAIPAATLARMVPRIRDSGHVGRGYLGVGLQRVMVPATAETEARPAAIVVTVDPSGPAHGAGILQGDIILALGDTPVTGVRSLYQQLGPDAVGRSLAVALIRAGARMTIEVTVTARPRT